MKKFLGTIHLRRRQIFTIFDPYPLPVGNRRHFSKMPPTPLQKKDVAIGQISDPYPPSFRKRRQCTVSIFGNFCPKIIFHVKRSRCRLIYHQNHHWYSQDKFEHVLKISQIFYLLKEFSWTFFVPHFDCSKFLLKIYNQHVG